MLLILAIGFPLMAAAWAQQPESPGPPPPPSNSTSPAPTRIEAKAQVIVNWTLGNETWDFSEVMSVYEPVKGYLEIPGDKNELPKAVWTLRLAKNLDEGTVKLHENGPLFKVTTLDADRSRLDKAPLPMKITPISGRVGDTVTMIVAMPDPPLLNEIRFVRVEPATNVGF
jgi:hypothetical protein